jgi:hypothetical protein
MIVWVAISAFSTASSDVYRSGTCTIDRLDYVRDSGRFLSEYKMHKPVILAYSDAPCARLSFVSELVASHGNAKVQTGLPQFVARNGGQGYSEETLTSFVTQTMSKASGIDSERIISDATFLSKAEKISQKCLTGRGALTTASKPTLIAVRY